MCDHGDTQPMEVPIPADLSHTGKARWAIKPIDTCISGIVRALNRASIYTRASCCGHGQGPGEIVLQDGRSLIIQEEHDA